MKVYSINRQQLESGEGGICIKPCNSLLKGWRAGWGWRAVESFL